jgi:hypothetical protein
VSWRAVLAATRLAHSINWSSAQVEPVGDFYELRINVDDTGNPARDRSWIEGSWGDAFNEEAARRYKAARGQRWGNVVMTGDTVLVQELEEGAEEELMKYLKQLVEETDRENSARPTQTQDDDGRRRMDTAGEMARRFRSPT